MRAKHFIAILFLFFGITTNAQNTYFQQEVNYTIHVSLNDQKHFLNGNVEMEYVNHSPDELSYIWIHLWPNAYASNETALGKEKLKDSPFSTILEREETRGYIDSLNFTSGSKKLDWEFHPKHTDICKVVLPNTLKPGESITINTPFRVKIPDGEISRLGHSKQIYSITQWYPKPAVYDQYGWHEMPYLDMGEFFSEFGSFDVYITVPENYRVAATGVLHNEAEKVWLDSLSNINPEDQDLEKTAPSANKTKTLHFSENRVHDFAWFADKNYHVQKSRVSLPNGKDVTTWTFFSDKNKQTWMNATSYVDDAVFYYSKWNGNYPYKNCTAVEGPLTAGGGMEYPGITVIGEFKNTLQLEEVIMHEVGHNWFYGFLASNERRYPYMDEGVNSANEQRYMTKKYPNYTLSNYLNNEKLGHLLGVDKVSYRQLKELMYSLNEKRNYDQPINLHSTEYTENNYGSIVYAKSANMFNHLRQYLGNDVYDSIFHNYYKKHVFQHVYPNDLENAFKEGTNKNLDWFFRDWLETTKHADYALKKSKGTQVLVRNSGPVNSPFLVEAVKDSVVTAQKWVDGFDGKEWIDLGTSNYDHVFIDRENKTYDFDRHNNYLKTKGLCKKTEPVKFKFGTGLDFTDQTEVYYVPFVTYTVPGGFMPGIKFHNKTPFQKQVEYDITPMYSFKSDLFAGSGKINFFIPLQSSFIRNVYINTTALQYAAIYDNSIQKLGTKLKFEFRDPVNNNHEFYFYSNATYATRMEDITYNNPNPDFNFYLNNGLQYKNISARFPMDIFADIETTSDFTRITFNADFKIGIARNKNLFIHFNSRNFIGDGPQYMFFRNQLMGTNGVTDYKYDNIFYDRFKGSAKYNGAQFVNDGGGFSVSSPEGFSNSWMNTLNLSYSLNSAIRPYINTAIYESLNKESRFACEAGFRLGIRDIAEVYFPLYYTNTGFGNAIKDNYNIYNDYKLNIRLMLNINKMNLFDLRNMIPY